MPTSWTTYWGNQLHGLFVTWSHDPAATGTAVLSMKFVANRYADPVKAGKTNALDKPMIDLGATSGSPNVANEFTFYVAWASTEASCKAICYDAVDGKALISLMSKSASTTEYHGWDVYWRRRFMQQSLTNCVVGDYGHNSGDTNCGTWDAVGLKCPTTTSTDSTNKIQFDLKPTVEYAQGEQYYDGGVTKDKDNVCQDAVASYQTQTGYNGFTVPQKGRMCTEIWQYTAPDNACVKFEGTLFRKFNTGDDASDLVLSYTRYEMHAQAGLTAKLTGADYKFAKQFVDFAYFAAKETGAATLSAGAAAVALGFAATHLM